MRRWYPTGGVRAVLQRLPHRSRGSITAAAKRYGIHCQWTGNRGIGENHRKLPPAVVAVLRVDLDRERAFPGMTISQIARALGVCWPTVAYHIRKGREFPADSRGGSDE